MAIDTFIILCVVSSCFGFLAFVAIFSATFYRRLGTRKAESHIEKEQHEFSEAEYLTPVSINLNESEIEYTTSIIQPVAQQHMAGYPHQSEEQSTTDTLEAKEEKEYSSDDIQTESDATVTTSATITILLRYDRQRSCLLLKLLNMFDLPLRKDKSAVNAFLEIRLLPQFGQNPIQTDMYPNSSHPKLNETFEFEVDPDELRLQTFEFVIMDAREYSNRSIGHALLNVNNLNMNEIMSEKEVNTVLSIGKPMIKKALSDMSLSSGVDSSEEMSYSSSMAEGLNIEPSQQRLTKATVRLSKDLEYVAGMEPMILLSLQYTKQVGKLFVAVVKVSNLKVLPNNKKPDTYVKIHIYVRNKMKMKKKTAVSKEELNPVYNQKLEFHVAEKDLSNVKIEMVIKNKTPTRGIRGKRGPLHQLVLGESATGSCLEHWQSAMVSNKPVAKWHVLN